MGKNRVTEHRDHQGLGAGGTGDDQVLEVLADLAGVGCRVVTVGQKRIDVEPAMGAGEGSE